MKNEIIDRLASLRKTMKATDRKGDTINLDAVIIPQTDPHQSEYLADHWQLRRYLTGFTGSAGTLVVTADSALLWTDSRYFIQAAQQLQGTGIELMKESIPGVPTIEEWLVSNLGAGSVVGVDGMIFSASRAKALGQTLAKHGIKLSSDYNPYKPYGIMCEGGMCEQRTLWPDRPELPTDTVFIHDEKYAGESAKDKLEAIRKACKAENAESILVTMLDEIAWTLNLRSSDVRYNPVATSYLYVTPTEATLFINEEKIGPEVEEYLKDINVRTMPYDSLMRYMSSESYAGGVLVDKNSTPAAIAAIIGENAVDSVSPIKGMKSIKNDVQISGFRAAMERDGAALVKAVMEMERMLKAGERLTEIGVEKLLRKYRSEQPLFFDESFGTIAGYGPHGAIVHYEATEETDIEIEPHGLLLIDSGVQYLDGTTDITRTICFGAPTDQEKHDFTLVMKGHIALAQAVFPVGTYGVQLDILARQYLWKEGLGYMHGTGHGVGHFLNVHEGPHQIRMNYIPATIKPGMITSNEPGLYREGVHGVRCENLVLCVPAMSTEFGDFLKFETITLFPFDLKLFQTEIMTPSEVEWVNAYHSEVRRRLSPLLNASEREWLYTKTEPLK